MFDHVPRLPLNAGQEAASEGFFNFLFSDQKELCISGPGGVGKTFLMGNLIDVVLPRYFEACQLMNIPAEFQEVVMTATTNKASEVLATQTLRPTETIHSFMNLVVKEDFKTGVVKISKSRTWQIHQRKIIFIDEASMIDSDLYDAIIEGTMKCKIIYVGDKDQLAPVKERISPVYNQNLPLFELLEPMRTSVPELQALNAQFRTTVQTGEFKPIQLVPGIIDHLDDEQMEHEITTRFAAQTDDRILAYTNQRVIDYNSFIREIRSLPADFQAGEYVVNNSAIRVGKARLSVEEEIYLQTVSSIVTSVDIAPGVQMDIRLATIQNSRGEILYDVPIPADRSHYTALVKYYQQNKDWTRYFHLKNTYPDFRQRDAATVYKAQGSSCNTVYVDVTNLSSCHNQNQAARLFYVAVSRARNRVAFYGTLAEKYGKFIQ